MRRGTRFRAVILAPALLGLAALLTPEPARAESADRTRALAILTALEAKPEHKQSASTLVARTRKALERARGANAAGDHRHAVELEALALELAESARDLARTLDAEREVAELARRAASAETRAVRAQALVEQTTARRGRAAAQLAALEAERAANAAGVPTKPAQTPAPKGRETAP